MNIMVKIKIIIFLLIFTFCKGISQNKIPTLDTITNKKLVIYHYGEKTMLHVTTKEGVILYFDEIRLSLLKVKKNEETFFIINGTFDEIIKKFENPVKLELLKIKKSKKNNIIFIRKVDWQSIVNALN